MGKYFFMFLNIIIFSRPFGRPNYKIIKFDLKRAIVRVPSIPLFSL